MAGIYELSTKTTGTACALDAILVVFSNSTPKGEKRSS